MVKSLPVMQEMWFWSLGQEDTLGKGMLTHSGILPWKILWTEETVLRNLDTTDWLTLSFSLHSHYGEWYRSSLKKQNRTTTSEVSESHSAMSDSLQHHGLYCPWNSPARILEWGFLFQGIFPIQGLDSGLLHCRWILYQLSYQGSSYITIYYVVKSMRRGAAKPW